MQITITILLFLISSTVIGQTVPLNPMEKNEIGFDELVSVENALKIGKAMKKRVLIYFSGYAVINARRIESFVLTNTQVKTLMIEKFSCFIAYIDDKTKRESGKLTTGEINAQIQVNYFKTNSQPYFCIIDENAKVLSQIGFVTKPEYFIEFLNDGLK